MKRNIKLYLQDIWESILAIEEYTKNLSEDEFYSNRQVQDAIVRRLEIIGEAVKNIDDGTGIPKYRGAGMRDIIAHEYFGVKLDRVWDTVRKDLPELKEKIGTVMEEEDA